MKCGNSSTESATLLQIQATHSWVSCRPGATQVPPFTSALALSTLISRLSAAGLGLRLVICFGIPQGQRVCQSLLRAESTVSDPVQGTEQGLKRREWLHCPPGIAA